MCGVVYKDAERCRKMPNPWKKMMYQATGHSAETRVVIDAIMAEMPTSASTARARPKRFMMCVARDGEMEAAVDAEAHEHGKQRTWMVRRSRDPQCS